MSKIINLYQTNKKLNFSGAESNGKIWFYSTDMCAKININNQAFNLIDESALQNNFIERINIENLNIERCNNLKDVIQDIYKRIKIDIPSYIKDSYSGGVKIGLLNGKYNPMCSYYVNYVLDTNIEKVLEDLKTSKDLKFLDNKNGCIHKIKKNKEIETINIDDDDFVLLIKTDIPSSIESHVKKRPSTIYHMGKKIDDIENESYVFLSEDNNFYQFRRTSVIKIMRSVPWAWDNIENSSSESSDSMSHERVIKERIDCLERKVQALEEEKIRVYKTGLINIYKSMIIHHGLDSMTCNITIYHDNNGCPGTIYNKSWGYTINNNNTITITGLIGKFWITIFTI